MQQQKKLQPSIASIGKALFGVLVFLAMVTNHAYAQMSAQDLSISKIVGNVYTVTGNLLTITRDSSEDQLKVYVPDSTPIEYQGKSLSILQLSVQDKLEIIANNGNVALYIDVLEKTAGTVEPTQSAADTPENTPAETTTDKNQTGSMIEIPELVARSGLKLSIGAGVIILGMIGIWVGLTLLGNTLSKRSKAKKKPETV